MSLLEAFEEACPYYMAWGMTYNQFWYGDVKSHKAYRKAHEIKTTEANTEAWLQGRYVYDALCAVSPILRAFSKARKPADYLEQPYDLFEEQRKAKELQEERERYERIQEKVRLFAETFNEKRNSEGKEAVDGGDSSGD